ncbi:MAG: hypothetical protein WCK89_22195 [bacterium]
MNEITITLEPEVMSDKSVALNLVLTQDTNRIVIPVTGHDHATLAADTIEEGLFSFTLADVVNTLKEEQP